MLTYYIDETGFTGEDLLSPEQLIFAQATNDFTPDESSELISSIFPRINAKELKHKRLVRSISQRQQVANLIAAISKNPDRAGIWVAHKEFALMTLIIDWWMEPLAYKGGLNLYKDGANLAMANMLFMTLGSLWPNSFRNKLLMHYQKMLRVRSPEFFSNCKLFIEKEMSKVKCNEDQTEVLRYFWPSFIMLGHQHVIELPKQVLDLALPGLVFIGKMWRRRRSGPWTVVHDQSSNMAKQKWLWDAFSSPQVASAVFQNPAGDSIFPLNVLSTRFAASEQEASLQVCDILAGAASTYLRLPKDDEYRQALSDAGIEKLIVGGLWPSTAVTSEELGMKGWDGNVAIEWISNNIQPDRKPEN